MVVEGAGGSVINSELGWRVSTGQSWAGLVAQCQEDREVASPGLLVKGLEEESERAGWAETSLWLEQFEQQNR